MLNSLLRTLIGWLRRSPSTPAEANRGNAAQRATATATEALSPVGFAESQLALREGRFEAAIDILESIATVAPHHVPTLIHLGFALTETSRHAAAIGVLRAALAREAQSADVHYLLGSALAGIGDWGAAAAHFSHALEWRPDFVFARRDLAKALHMTGRDAEARGVLERALIERPDVAEFHYFLGNILQLQHDPDAALQSYRSALRLEPAYAPIHSNMAPAYLAIGEYTLAAAAARAALAIDPLMHAARSNLLVALSSNPEISPEAYRSEAALYGEIVSASVVSDIATPMLNRRAERRQRLRVGFVSSDLRSHPVGYFLEGLLLGWDRSAMTAMAYSNHRGEDALTARLKPRFDLWRDISMLNDAAACAQIRADEIDVLIDLSGHTAENRLTLFAQRPAALQLSWLGYWASTGLPAIDAVLTDRVSLPLEEQAQFTERVAYLPVTRLCFTPPSAADATSVGELTAPPALATGHITFGSFQRLTKINDRTLARWAAVLNLVSGSRLRLQAARLPLEPARSTLLSKLQAHGIDPDRVDLADATSRARYFEAHGAVDIILDTFPHAGATTTCEALWMGVPTMTLAGRSMLSRQGASLLAAVGLSDWIAHDEATFIEQSTRHAGDWPTLSRLRTELRPQLLASPLTDGTGFARHFQSVLASLLNEQKLAS